MPDARETKKTCFVAMPISTPEHLRDVYGHGAEHFHYVLNHLFEPAIEKAGMTCISPISSGSEIIHADIIKNLVEADLVLCDCSSLNANVFFEFGIRTALDKPVAVVRDLRTPNIPFDVSLINHHPYDPSLTMMTGAAEIEKLATHLRHTLERSNGKNAMWSKFGFQIKGESPTPPVNKEDKLDLLLQSVEALSDRLAANTRRPGGITLPAIGFTGTSFSTRGGRSEEQRLRILNVCHNVALEKGVQIDSINITKDAILLQVPPETPERASRELQAELSNTFSERVEFI